MSCHKCGAPDAPRQLLETTGAEGMRTELTISIPPAWPHSGQQTRTVRCDAIPCGRLRRLWAIKYESRGKQVWDSTGSDAAG